MRRFSYITTFILSLGLLFTAQAAGPDDSFIQAYSLIAQGDNLAQLGQKKSAIQKYRQARNDLAALQSGYPNWNSGIVNFRIKYVDQKLKAIGDETPETAAPSAQPTVLDPAAARRDINTGLDGSAFGSFHTCTTKSLLVRVSFLTSVPQEVH